MSLVPIYRSTLCGLHKTANGLNSIQVRTSFYNRYKHGPTKVSNPEPDKIQWMKDFFSGEGLEFFKKHAKRIIRKPIDETHGPKRVKAMINHKFEKFDSDERIKLWKPVADSDSKNGYSIATFSRSPSGYGLFSGVLDSRVPDDGLTQRSGFVAAIGERKLPEKLGEVDATFDWSNYNCLNIRFRGDGRKYHVIVNTGRYDNDLMGYDIYFYPIHTRGGPYWQEIKIPFNKLIFASKAFVQNTQFALPRDSVKFVGFNLLDTFDGPFSLEIAWIGISYEYLPDADNLLYEQYAFPHMSLKQISPGCDPPDTE